MADTACGTRPAPSDACRRAAARWEISQDLSGDEEGRDL